MDIIDSTHNIHYKYVGNDSTGVQFLGISSANSSNVYKRKRLIPDSIINKKCQSLEHKNCIDQNTKGFGFILFNELMTYTGHEVVWGSIPSIIEAHEMTRRSAMPNFMKVRIPVQIQLNVEAWKKYLDLY